MFFTFNTERTEAAILMFHHQRKRQKFTVDVKKDYIVDFKRCSQEGYNNILSWYPSEKIIFDKHFLPRAAENHQ